MVKAIELNSIYKEFDAIKKNIALNDISFSCNEGEITGFLGINGAGKSTTMRILSGLLIPDKGTAHIKGVNVNNKNKIRKMVGLDNGDVRAVYWRLTGRENLDLFGRIYGLNKQERKNRIEELNEYIQLGERLDDLMEKYSRGMIRRIQIARSLIHDPEILLLDEPTTGLDIMISKDIRNSITQLVKERNKTILYSSHNLNEVESICDRVIVIHKGKIIADDTPKNIASKTNMNKTKIEILVDGKIENCFTNGIIDKKANNTMISLNDEPEAYEWTNFYNQLVKENLRIIHIKRDEYSLEEGVLELIK